MGPAGAKNWGGKSSDFSGGQSLFRDPVTFICRVTVGSSLFPRVGREPLSVLDLGGAAALFVL